MLMIGKMLGQETNNYGINATEIKQVRGEWGLGDKLDRLIAEPKGSGFMSSKLHSLTEATRAKAPLYELNLSLFRNKERGSNE
jgi:hypothetical protein